MPTADDRDDRAPAGIGRLLHACSVPVSLDDIAEAVLDAARPLGAAGVVLIQADPMGNVTAMSMAGTSRTIAPALGPLAFTKRYPLMAAVLECRALWLPSRSAFQARFPEFAASRPAAEAIADLPLRNGDTVIGAIGIPFSVARSFPDVERTYLLAVAELTSRAVQARAAAPPAAAHPDEALLDRLHDAAMVIDHTSDRVTYANEAAADLTGRSRSELIGLPADVLLEQVVAIGDRRRRLALDQLGWGVHRVVVVRPDGTRRTSEVHIAEADDRGHRAFVAIDITDRQVDAPYGSATDERIAREVHDRAVQAVFATSMGLAALAQAVRPALRPQVEALLDDLDEVVEQLRTTGEQPGLVSADDRSVA
jgi:PAS domain S-box-containing protein